MSGEGKPLARHIEALAAEGRQSRMRLMAMKMRALVYRNKVNAYRSCFLNAEGQVSEAGAIVLADLGRLAGLGVARPQRTTEEIHFDEGQRRIVLHLIEHLHLDADKLARWARQLRETDNDGRGDD